MYPAEFEYFAPATVDEALDLLARYGEDAKILAGGQSLLPMMKLRIASPRYLIDVNRIEALTGLQPRRAIARDGRALPACGDRGIAARARTPAAHDAMPRT